MSTHWLNYHHLLYFWLTAKLKGVGKAAKELRLAPSTISAQIQSLENVLGHQLFERDGKSLNLSEAGRVAFKYAEDIFSLGGELISTLENQSLDRPIQLEIGVADVVPKFVAHKLISPALQIPSGIKIICRENKTETLVSELAAHKLDLVIADCPVAPWIKVKVFSHKLGEWPVMLYGTKALVDRYAQNFPKSLHMAPFLLPTSETALRHSLDAWFTKNSIMPKVVGEFEDNALMKVFGQMGVGFFASSSAVKQEMAAQMNLIPVSILDNVVEKYYAISMERKVKHPGVTKILEQTFISLGKSEAGL